MLTLANAPARRAARGVIAFAVVVALLALPFAALAQTVGAPAKPASLVAIAGNARATLHYVSGGDSGSAITGWQYRVAIGPDASGAAWTDIAASALGGANASSVTVTHLPDGGTALVNDQQYTLEVRALNDFDDDGVPDAGPPSDPATVVPSATAFMVPDKPQLAALGGNAEAQLNFGTNDSGGAPIARWQYQQSDLPAGDNWGLEQNIASTQMGLSHSVTGLTNGSTYRFRVRAMNNRVSDWSPWSDAATVTPYAPLSPTAVAVDSTTLTVTFGETLDSAMANTPAPIDFTVVVNGSVAEVSGVSIPAAPSDNEVRLTLANAVAATSPVTVSYTRGNNPLQGTNGAPVAGFGPMSTSPAGMNSPPVFALNFPIQLTVPENSPAGTPLVVLGTTTVAQFTATDADAEDTVTLSLVDTTSGSGHASSFAFDEATGQIVVAPGAVIDYETLSSYSVSIEARSGTDTVTLGVTIAVADVTVPSFPRSSTSFVGGVQAGQALDGAIRFIWSKPESDGGAPVTAYKVYWYEASDSGTVTTTSVTLPAGTEERSCYPRGPASENYAYTITGLTNGTEYGVSVTAVNSEGESLFIPLHSATTGVTTLPYTADAEVAKYHFTPTTEAESADQPNRIPTNLSVSVLAASQLRVTWDAPASTAGQPLHYEVEWSDSPSFCGVDSATTADSASRQHDITGLTASQPIWISVALRYKASAGDEGNILGTPAFVTSTVLGAPGVPEDLAVGPGDGELKLTWSAPQADGGLPVARYEVRWGPAGGMKNDPTSVGVTTSHTITGLTNGQTYEVEVRAVNSGQDAGGTARSYESAWASGSGAPNRVPMSGPFTRETVLDTAALLTADLFPFADDNDALTAVIIDEPPDPKHGRLGTSSANLAAGSRLTASDLAGLQFTPARGFLGDASFTFRVEDGSAAVSSAHRADIRVLLITPPPRLHRLSLVSDPGADATYVAGDKVLIRAAFTESVTVAGVPQLRINLVSGNAAMRRTAVYQSGGGTSNLIFSYIVQPGDNAPSGLSLPANPLLGIVSAPGDGGVVTAHQAQPADPHHRVDTRPPSPSSVTVNASIVTLRFDEPLDASSLPVTQAFGVTVGDDEARQPDTIAVDGSVVRLKMADNIAASRAVTVVYTRATAGSPPLRDVAGNEAADFEARRLPNSQAAGSGNSPATAASTIFIANGWRPPDMALAALLASRNPRAAVLWTQDDALPSSTARTLRQHQPHHVVVVGGADAVSVGAFEEVRRASGVGTPERVGGGDRIETAIAAAKRAWTASSATLRTALVVNGWRTDDISVATAWAAGIDHGALLFTAADSLSDETAQLLRDYRPGSVVIVGSPDAVSPAVEARLRALLPAAEFERGHGGGTNGSSSSQAALAADIARRVLGNGPAAGATGTTLVLVNGERFADVVVAAVSTQSTLHAAVLLTEPQVLPAETEAVLRRYRPQSVLIVGGTDVVGKTVERRILAVVPNTRNLSRCSGVDRDGTAAACASRILFGRP